AEAEDQQREACTGAEDDVQCGEDLSGRRIQEPFAGGEWENVLCAQEQAAQRANAAAGEQEDAAGRLKNDAAGADETARLPPELVGVSDRHSRSVASRRQGDKAGAVARGIRRPAPSCRRERPRRAASAPG